MSSLEQKMEDFEKSIQNLKVASANFTNDAVYRDGTIKRFEICYDLSWKCLQQKLKLFGIEVFNPRNSFIEGVKAGLIPDPQPWIDLIEIRNQAVHSYDLMLANEIYLEIPKHIPIFEELFISLKKEL